MREQLKFGVIRTHDELESLKRFAESFNHRVGDDTIHPIYTIDFGGRMIGYYNVIQYPIVCPAMHPKVCTPRNFVETMQSVKNHFFLTSINGQFPHGTCLLAVPRELPIPRRALEKSGFQDTKMELWQAIPS
jgi:hypothetical protein